MAIAELNRQEKNGLDPKLSKKLENFEKLLKEITKQYIPPETEVFINAKVTALNNFPGNPRQVSRELFKTQSAILQQLEKDCKLVPKNYYRNQWMVLGMTAFGLPLGVIIGLMIDNIGLLAVGLPIGMGMGLALGTAMDKKAFAKGLQLDVSLGDI